jgi:transposase
MDNLSCHKTAEVARLIGATGIEERYLAAYKPGPESIERLFSKLKAWQRSAKARTVEALIEAMGDAPRAVRPSDWIEYPEQFSSSRITRFIFIFLHFLKSIP